MKRKVYQELAGRICAYENCIESNNKEWEEKHREVIQFITKEYLPHGSGIDGKTEVWLTSTDDKLVIESEYHVMDENGYYDGWIDFKVIVKPSLQFGIRLSIKGNFGKHQHIKEYLYEVYRDALEQEIDITA